MKRILAMVLALLTLTGVAKAEDVVVYKDDEGIQKFISVYNELYPDNAITSDMLRKYERGITHDDKVILYINNHEISIDNDSGIFTGDCYDISVFISNWKVDNNDEIKTLFFMFMKVYDKTLTDEILENYWAKQSDNSHYSNMNTYGDIECYSTVFRDIVEYIKIEGHIAK